MSVYRQAQAPAGACPRCYEQLLDVAGRSGVKHCPKCGGIFADIATSNRILEAMDRELLAIGFEAAAGRARVRDDGRYLSCPECQIDMVKNHVASAACDVDACPLHGTWFDTGELVDVIRAYERARKRGLTFTHDRKSVPANLATEDEPAKDLGAMLADFLTTR